ncbi:MAG: 16S rRNA (guanine(527)-N(7))-methyltransferase RsmG [Peptococcaceae bacterium]|nr:16S rRNA (guanine(527)-N(7))-methyltransferase RsmG [Peptococcaceae bacterium]
MSAVTPVSYLETGARRLGLHLTRVQSGLFLRYLELMAREKQNLTTVTSSLEIVEKHFLDSLTVALAVEPAPGSLVLDVGSGAGFPGIPLKILLPGIRLVLLEPRTNRAMFLKHTLYALGLAGVTVERARAEDYLRDQRVREKFTLVTARAVAPLAVLAEYCLPALAPGGLWVAQKGPEADREISEARGCLEVMGGGTPSIRRLTLPYSGAVRVLVTVPKVKNTPAEYPRRAGVPARRPLAGKKAKGGEYLT